MAEGKWWTNILPRHRAEQKYDAGAHEARLADARRRLAEVVEQRHNLGPAMEFLAGLRDELDANFDRMLDATDDATLWRLQGYGIALRAQTSLPARLRETQREIEAEINALEREGVTDAG